MIFPTAHHSGKWPQTDHGFRFHMSKSTPASAIIWTRGSGQTKTGKTGVWNHLEVYEQSAKLVDVWGFPPALVSWLIGPDRF
jgi:hypothetical protein